MKNKIASLILFFIVLPGIFSYSKRNNLFSEIGFIKTYGNEPFLFPVFEDLNGNKYNIDADEKTKKELISLQGKRIVLSGEVEELKSSEDKKNLYAHNFATIKFFGFEIIEQ